MSREELEEMILDRYDVADFIDLVDLELSTLLSVWDGWLDSVALREDLGLEE